MLVGLLGLCVLAVALIEEQTGTWVQGIGGAVSVTALSFGWAVVHRPGSPGDSLWHHLPSPYRVAVAGAAGLTGVAVLLEASSTGSLLAAFVVVAALGGALVLAWCLFGLVHEVARRWGARWSTRAVEGAILLSSTSIAVAILLGTLLTPSPFPGADDVLAAGTIWLPLGLLVAAAVGAVVGTWRDDRSAARVPR